MADLSVLIYIHDILRPLQFNLIIATLHNPVFSFSEQAFNVQPFIALWTT